MRIASTVILCVLLGILSLRRARPATMSRSPDSHALFSRQSSSAPNRNWSWATSKQNGSKRTSVSSTTTSLPLASISSRTAFLRNFPLRT